VFSTYIADISKGILIVVVGGLGAGVVLSLVRERGRFWLAVLVCVGGVALDPRMLIGPMRKSGKKLCFEAELAHTRKPQSLTFHPRPQVWMLVLRFFAGVMAWATIAIVNAALVACTLYAYALAGKLSSVSAFGENTSRRLNRLLSRRVAGCFGLSSCHAGAGAGAALRIASTVETSLWGPWSSFPLQPPPPPPHEDTSRNRQKPPETRLARGAPPSPPSSSPTPAKTPPSSPGRTGPT
jgi:hypothetical protein